MVNRVCYPMTKVPYHNVATIVVPAMTTLYPGSIVLADTYASLGRKNYSVFAVTQPQTANLSEQMAIVINGGWEMLPDGRRPEGQPDYTKYEFTAGEVVTIVFLEPKMRFQISFDCITGTPAVGKFLYPTDQAYLLTEGDAVPAATFSSFKVLALMDFGLGGQAGAQFASTVVAMVQQPTLAVDPD